MPKKEDGHKSFLFGSDVDFDSKQLAVILKLGIYGAINNPIDITSSELGRYLDVSQQTAARYLVDLEKNHLIERTRTSRGQSVQITKLGRELLENLSIMITKALYSQTRSAIIYGEIESGLGEGAWYITQEEYTNQFEDILGFVPFPGTLNLRILNLDDLKKIAQIRQSEPYIIHGFVKKGRQFGDVMCYKARFEDGSVGAIIVPSRTHHNKDILEAIAPINLREKLAENPNIPLRDGKNIRIEVFLQ
ncbi:MAG: CTP-dependent riboflavin kinase [Asgard group archaeon]|nr:CTP-dependent riboflavin kinase [Asgard group archaeon]